MTFTDKQLQDFKAYRRVQKSGAYNMFDPRARAMAGVGRDEWVFCMEHYDELLKQAEAESA